MGQFGTSGRVDNCSSSDRGNESSFTVFGSAMALERCIIVLQMSDGVRVHDVSVTVMAVSVHPTRST